MDALIDGLTTGGFDGHQAIITNAAQDLDHLPVAIIAALQFASDRGHGRRQNPILERSAIAQGTGFTRQNRHIVPRIIDRLAPAKSTRMGANDRPILPDDDPLGIGMHLDRPADRSRQDGILVVVEPHRAGLRY